MQTKHQIWGILMVQLSLLCIGFNKLLVRPMDFMFKNQYDGLKNYFTLESYLEQDSDVGLLRFEGMNYPFGESIFYTDNTPALAIPLQVLSYLGLDIASYSVLIMNVFCLLSILFSTYLCFKILTHLLDTTWLIAVLSLALPWINPQILRLDVGHFNLSWSWVILWTIYLLLQIFKTYQQQQQFSKKQLFVLGGILFLSGWIHLYYLILLTILVGSFGVFWSIFNFKNRTTFFKIIKYLPLLLLPIGFVWGIIHVTDLDYAARLSPGGYNWTAWTLKFGTLHTPYNLMTLPFIVHSDTDFYYEDLCYLGSFTLYGGLFLMGAFLLKSIRQAVLEQLSNLKTEVSFLLYLVLASLVLLFISMGDYVFLENGTKIYNVFSLFFYANFIDDSLMQFRCLARFGWVFFWASAFVVAFGLDRLWQLNHQILKGGIVILAFCLVSDTHDFIKYYNHIAPHNTLTYTDNFKNIETIVQKIEPSKYQAILPLPYFHTGSENMNYTIDATSEHFKPTLQLAQLTNLPLMSTQLSRTAEYQVKALFTLFTADAIDTPIQERLTDQPILVFYNKNLLETDQIWNTKQAEPAKTVIHGSKAIIEKYQMELIVENEEYQLYEWNLK